MNILILAFAVLYTILAKLRLDWAVIFLIAALPSYLIRFEVLGAPFTLLETMILISFTIWFLFHTEFRNFFKGRYGWREFKENKKKRKKYPFGLEVSLLLIISFIAVAVSGFSNTALGIWKAYFFEPVLVFILILNLSKGKNGFNKVLWSLALSVLAVSIIAIYQKFTGAWIVNDFWAAEETRRVTSFFGYPNAVGLYLGPIVMVLIGWLASNFRFQISRFAESRRADFRLNKLKHYFLLLVIILSILSIYLAKSKGALVAVAVGLIIFGLLGNKKIRWVTMVSVIIIGAAIVAYQPARDYAIRVATLKNLSGEIRKQQWRETWAMLKDGYLLTGSGLANYQQVIKPYHQEGIFFNKDNDPDFRRKIVWFSEEYKKKYWQPVEIYLYPHNIFLNFWTELGLAGVLLFAWIIGKYFYLLFRNWKLEIGNLDNSKNRYLTLGLMCSMITIVVHGIVDVPYFKNDLSVMFWVLIAMMSLLSMETRNKNI